MPEAYYVIPMTTAPYSRENPQRPMYVDEIACNWTGHNVDALGIYVCKVNTTAAKHALLAASLGVDVLPEQYTWDTVISTMHAAARNFVRNLMENRLGIPYDSSETLGQALMRIINSGLFDLGNTSLSTQFANLNQGQQNKIIQLCEKWGLQVPQSTETVRQITNRTGPVWWPGNNLDVVEY